MGASDILVSNVVGEWRDPSPMFMCPGGYVDDGPCDCGFHGPWAYRSVLTWNESPGFVRPARADHRDVAEGRPPLSREGWWVISGWDERCPGCGDIERFDHDGDEVARFAGLNVVQDEVVVGSSDLRRILAMTDLLTGLDERETAAVQRARAALTEKADA